LPQDLPQRRDAAPLDLSFADMQGALGRGWVPADAPTRRAGSEAGGHIAPWATKRTDKQFGNRGVRWRHSGNTQSGRPGMRTPLSKRGGPF